MKTMKKVISVLMMVCILASFMTVAAYADGVESVSLTPSATKVKVGETFTVTPATFTSGSDVSRKVTWSYSEDLTCLGTDSESGAKTFSSSVAATYSIIITSEADSTKTATCSVTVEAAPAATPATVSILAPASTDLIVGSSIALQAEVKNGSFGYWEVAYGSAGNGTFDVTSGNTKVNFTATKAGTVNIVAYTSTGVKSNVLTLKISDKRTLDVATNVTRIDNKEVVWFYVKNAQNDSENFTWSYSATPAGLSIITASSTSYAPNFSLTGGKGNGNVTVTATSANGETGSITVPVNSMGYGDAKLSPTNVTWAKGQGNLTFTVEPTLYSAYIDDVCITGSGNTAKYSYVYSSNNLVINSSYLATLAAGEHVLRVDTVYSDGSNAGTQYAYITVSGTASAAYGDNAHVRGTTSDLYFNSNGQIKSVTISGTTIDPANYTLSNNGKTITLKANFLNLLNYGSYTMKLENSNGGTETATFRVVTANYAPATGDESNLAIWVAVMLLSGAGALALIPRKKKEM